MKLFHRLIKVFILLTVVPINCNIKKDKFFVIVIASYNNKYWYQRNLNSIFNQNYKNYKVIYVDDCSPDHTGILVENYIDQSNFKDKVILVKNKERKGCPLANHFYAINNFCKPTDIVVCMDGDDWFSNENVLNYLNDVYQNSKVWVTYGQLVHYPGGELYPSWDMPKDVIEKNGFREYHWITTHLKTFYAGLFQKIKKEDLLYEGKFFPMAGDLAFMFPIIEMAGYHIKFTPYVSYVYNKATELNEEKINFNLQMALTQVIRTKEKYQPILNPFEQINKKTIYLNAWHPNLFDISNPTLNRDNCLEPNYKLKLALEKIDYEIKQVGSVKQIENPELIIVFDTIQLSDSDKQYLSNFSKEKLILFLIEPPSVLQSNYDKKIHEQFGKVFTFCDDLIDNKKYFKYYYPVLNPMINDSVDFDNKKLCTMIIANKSSCYSNELYSERLKIINFFEQIKNNDFDFFGFGWDSSKFNNYKGIVRSKVDCLKNYKFCICYENLRINGYITEKIFDVFQSGCVPIYLGAPNIEKYIPKECFIDRNKFNSDQELYDFIKNINKDEYEKYIENIKKYLNSEKAQQFSTQNYVQTFKEIIFN